MFQPTDHTHAPDPARHLHRLYAVTAGVLVFGLLWSLAVFFLAINDCGLTIPHQHALLGGARSGDLAHHLRAERNCQPAALSADAHSPSIAGSAPHVLSFISLDAQINSLILIVPTAIVPALLMAVIRRPLWSRGLAFAQAAPRPETGPPPTPPPEFA